MERREEGMEGKNGYEKKVDLESRILARRLGVRGCVGDSCGEG